jgi:hypothetical protein
MMDREAILKRRDQLLAEERSNECRWFYLSFADERGFKGSCFVLAPGFASAVERARALGLNPGGEVRGAELLAGNVPPSEMQNRLLSMADLEADGGAVRWN